MLRMSMLLAVATLAGFCGPALAQAGNASCDPAFVAQAQRLIDAYRVQHHVPGTAVAFYDHGRTCFFTSGRADARGDAVTRDTAFAMGSVQKSFSSTLLAIAIEQGKAGIDDPAARYLVAGNGERVRPGVPFSRVTLRNLVTHTSALPRQPPGKRETSKTLFTDRPLPAKVITFLDHWRPAYPPGSKYVYSNFGFVLAAEAAVRLGGASYTRLLARDITEPLGMTRTGMFCQTPQPGCAENFGLKGERGRLPVGLWTTAHDLLRYVEAGLGEPAAPRRVVAAMALTHKELFRDSPDHAVGMAWEIHHQGENLLLAKDGWDSGSGTWIGMQPHRERGVAVLSNGGDSKGVAPKLGKQLLALAAHP